MNGERLTVNGGRSFMRVVTTGHQVTPTIEVRTNSRLRAYEATYEGGEKAARALRGTVVDCEVWQRNTKTSRDRSLMRFYREAILQFEAGYKAAGGPARNKRIEAHQPVVNGQPSTGNEERGAHA